MDIETGYRAYLYTTRRCDVLCWYCNVPLVDAERGRELPDEHWLTILDRLKEMGVGLVVFGGGECTLRMNLLKLAIPRCIENGQYPVLLTNGRLISKSPWYVEALAELQARGLDNISVSVDDPYVLNRPLSKEEQGEGSLSKSQTGILALEIAKSMGFGDLGITAVLNDANPQPTLDLLARLEGSGYDIRIALLQTRTDRKDTDSFQRAGAVKMTLDQKQRFRAAVTTILMNMERWNVKNTESYFLGILADEHKRFVCFEPGYVVVEPDGAVQLCQNVYGSHLRDELNLSTTTLRGEELKDLYIKLWNADVRDHCPGCYINCSVDFTYRISPLQGDLLIKTHFASP